MIHHTVILILATQDPVTLKINLNETRKANKYLKLTIKFSKH